MGFASRRWREIQSAREYLVAGALVALVVGALYAYAGTWPPMVVIESGSMMHPASSVEYGRVGTIDPGDLVLVQRVADPSQVNLWVHRGEKTYGDHGDVIVFDLPADGRDVPIIHRAVAWVTVFGELHDNGRDTRTYEIRWLDGELLTFGVEGIYMPELRMNEPSGFTRREGYKPLHSGFITWGDNRATNSAPDQVLKISPQPVHPDWVQGKARGELPWFGLIRLSFGEKINEYNPAWIRMPFTNAYAPADLWTMLFISLGLLVATPLAYDLWRDYRRRKRFLAGEEPRETSTREAEAQATRTVFLSLLTAGAYIGLWAYRAAHRRRAFGTVARTASGEGYGPKEPSPGVSRLNATLATPNRPAETHHLDPHHLDPKVAATARPATASAHRVVPERATDVRNPDTKTPTRTTNPSLSRGGSPVPRGDRGHGRSRAVASLQGEGSKPLPPAVAALLFFPGLLLALPAVYGVYRLTSDARAVAGSRTTRDPRRAAMVFGGLFALALGLGFEGHRVIPGGIAIVGAIAAGLAALTFAVHVVGDTHDDIAVAALRANDRKPEDAG